MTRRPALRKQSGVALILLLVLLVLAGGYAFYRSTNVAGSGTRADVAAATALARAKEALIARAVSDDNRPGSLPCPDVVTNSPGLANIPGDGKADMFTLTQCPSYVGWLPFVTLDLPELLDDSGTRLWYALSPTLRDDDSAQPINADTAMPLQLDGAQDIAAVVVAPQAALPGQQRPSNLIANYLEGENGNGDDRIFVSGPPGPGFNDRVVAITRGELMAAVEKRVAGAVRSCLEQHAASPANAARTYPWPSPFAATALRGTAGSLFGQVPATQPGAGLEVQLREAANSLATAKSALVTASTATDQLAALQVVADAAAFTRAYFDKLYVVAATLATSAGTTRSAFAGLDANIDLAATNGRISRTERTTLRAEALTVRDSLAVLQSGLADSGLDPFPGELQARSLALQQALSGVAASPGAAALGMLAATADGIAIVLALASTPNPDIAAALSTASANANGARAAAQAAVANSTDAGLVAASTAAGRGLDGALSSLRSTITTRRVNIAEGDIAAAGMRVGTARAAYAAAPGAATATALAEATASLNALASGIATASSPVVAARSASLAASADTAAALAGGNDTSTILATSDTAATAAATLAAAIAGNGDNVARTSLAATAARFASAQTAFDSITGITQAAMVPYVRALQGPGDEVLFWSDLVQRNATDLAGQARKAPGTAADNSASAYVAADRLLTGVTGTSGAQSALQAYIESPGSAARQAAATAALASTTANIDAVSGLATSVDGTLESGAAAALPTVWYGTACAFLQPPSGTSSWWTANAWANTTFYQISERVRPATGRLTVNGTGAYRVVALAAGRALAGQNRATRAVINFLEGSNADASRDGAAANPATAFANAPVSATFNDRIAF
jgi:hypothetical protein